jgi:hypothetical protein
MLWKLSMKFNAYIFFLNMHIFLQNYADAKYKFIQTIVSIW